MGNFFRRTDRGGEDRWWLEVTGKGDKIRLVPITRELMLELASYRRALGLPTLPQENERTPPRAAGLVAGGGEGRRVLRAAAGPHARATRSTAWSKRSSSRQLSIWPRTPIAVRRVSNACARHRLTGSATQQRRGWPMATPICGMFETTSDTPRSAPQASTSTRRTTIGTAHSKEATASAGVEQQAPRPQHLYCRITSAPNPIPRWA